MKIVCGSCGARYSIADDKVAGRAVRIRCKLCGESMVVRGAAPADATPPSRDTVGEAVWHVVERGDPKGPFPAGEVTRMLADGSIDEQTYVWRAGLTGWLRVHEIPELCAGVAGPSQVVVSLAGTAAELGAGAGMTGARSESSVLFSLGNLQSLALRGRPTPRSASPSAVPGGSGLLDLRALMGGASAAVPTGTGHRGIDDLLTVGAAGTFPTALGAPLVIPAAGRSSRLLHALVATAATLLLAIVALLAVALTPSPRAPVVPPPPPPVFAPLPLAPAPPAAASPAPAVPAPSPPAPAPDAIPPRATGPRRPAIDPPPARPPATPASPDAPRPTGTESIAELVRRAVGPEHPVVDPRGEARPEPTPPPRAALPAQPDRADVQSALRAVQGAVRACGAGQVGTASMRFAFAPNGVVTTASVMSPPFAGTPAGSCMARAARAARVPPFSRSSLVVSFPFVVR